ncbi:hypothetical protein K438DRAFT_373064 [Mycena galopus ATCC 62051]|nr:hypothetical protein K438DRAFT_373064 [Mycena galopus ATCC 62051]
MFTLTTYNFPSNFRRPQETFLRASYSFARRKTSRPVLSPSAGLTVPPIGLLTHPVLIASVRKRQRNSGSLLSSSQPQSLEGLGTLLFMKDSANSIKRKGLIHTARRLPGILVIRSFNYLLKSTFHLPMVYVCPPKRSFLFTQTIQVDKGDLDTDYKFEAAYIEDPDLKDIVDDDELSYVEDGPTASSGNPLPEPAEILTGEDHLYKSNFKRDAMPTPSGTFKFLMNIQLLLISFLASSWLYDHFDRGK